MISDKWMSYNIILLHSYIKLDKVIQMLTHSKVFYFTHIRIYAYEHSYTHLHKHRHKHTPAHTHTHTNMFIYIYIYHHVVPLARISLTLSRHFSLSFIASGMSSGLHPVSSHSCCMYVLAGRPAFARPYVAVHRSTSLMSSSLLLQ